MKRIIFKCDWQSLRSSPDAWRQVNIRAQFHTVLRCCTGCTEGTGADELKDLLTMRCYWSRGDYLAGPPAAPRVAAARAMRNEPR